MTCRHALVLARDDAYREWIYTTMTRASEANRLYVVGERQRGRDRQEFAPDEPATDGRVLLAAALQQTRADELAIERLLPQSETAIARSAANSELSPGAGWRGRTAPPPRARTPRELRRSAARAMSNSAGRSGTRFAAGT